MVFVNPPLPILGNKNAARDRCGEVRSLFSPDFRCRWCVKGLGVGGFLGFVDLEGDSG